MKLIVGLGNPGPKYSLTRHNIGFMLADVLAAAFGQGLRWKSEFKAETMKIQLGRESVMLCKPQTFMNLSGEAVQGVANMYKIAMADILVAHDEIDIPFGQMRFQTKRGAGGHNGIKSVHQLLGSDEYGRLRLGVGRPQVFVDDEGRTTRPAMEVHEYVLHPFSKEEQQQLRDSLFGDFVEAVEVWVEQGLDRAASEFNKSRDPEQEK
jgi:PTH1 family peptidyl-tRNA hydrolase